MNRFIVFVVKSVVLPTVCDVVVVFVVSRFFVCEMPTGKVAGLTTVI